MNLSAAIGRGYPGPAASEPAAVTTLSGHPARALRAAQRIECRDRDHSRRRAGAPGAAPGDECAIRIAATGDVHLGPRGRPGALGGGLRRPARPRRPGAAGGRSHHARGARAGRDGRRGSARRRRAGAGGARQPRLARQSPRRGRRRAARGRHRRARARSPRARAVRDRARRRGLQGVRRRLRRRAHPGLRRAADARGLRRVDARGRRARRRPARDRALPVPDRAAALRPDHRDAAGRAPRHLALPRHRPARGAAARAPSRPRAARPRACRHVPRSARRGAGLQRLRPGAWARTSGCSS